jgi:hypothetical protein
MLACTRPTQSPLLLLLMLAAARPPSSLSLLSYRHYTCSHRAYLRAHTHPVTTLATS